MIQLIINCKEFFVFDPTNIVNPEYWFDKPLIYTHHAQDRRLQRAIKFHDYLPINSKLMDCEKDANNNVSFLCFKINDDGDCYIVTHDGVVITVFNSNDKKFDAYTHRKNLRRFHKNKLIASFGSTRHCLIPKKYAMK